VARSLGRASQANKYSQIVATSSTEAEFYAAVAAVKTAKYLRSVLSELGFPQAQPTQLYEDNQVVIHMINGQRPTSRTRHVEIQWFAIQQWKLKADIVAATWGTTVSHTPPLLPSGPTHFYVLSLLFTPFHFFSLHLHDDLLY
jgi:ribonuclease HI